MPATNNMTDGMLKRPHSDAYIARILAAACIVLYLLVFGIIFLVASAHGTPLVKMIGLTQGESSDITEYVHLAHSMIEHGRFALFPAGAAEFLRTPGYPAFLALVLLAFHTLIVVPLFQIVITACTVALIYLIGARYFTRSVAIAAAVIYMCDPIVIYAAWTPLSESLFMLFFVGSVYMLGVHARRTWLPYIAAGILFAISVYMRPIGLYVSPIVAGMILTHTNQWRTAVKGAAVFLITIMVLLAPWMVRNYALSGHFAFSSSGAYNLYAANMPIFEQFRTGVPYTQIQEKYNAQFGTNDEHVLRSFTYASQESAIARGVLLAHPFQYLVFHLLKSAELFVGSSIVHVTYQMHQFGILSGEHAQGEGAWGMIVLHHWRDAFVQIFTHIPRLVERIFWVLAYCGAVYATVLAVRRRSVHPLWIICAFLLMNAFAILTGPSSDTTRYRMPAEPFLLLLAAYGAYSAWPRIIQWFRQTKKW